MPLVIPDSYSGGGWASSSTPAPDAGGSTLTDSNSPRQMVVDGTPARVAVLGIASAALIVALRWSGIRFNVAVSS